MVFGMATSSLVSRWGIPPISIAGTVTCIVSLVSTSFAANINVMYFTFSILYGIGSSLAYTPTMCISDDYFKKYSSLATGITVAGSSVGTLLLSPLTGKMTGKVAGEHRAQNSNSIISIQSFASISISLVPVLLKVTLADIPISFCL